MSESDYNASMDEGIKKLLGAEDYEVTAVPRACEHQSDGHKYDETQVYTTLKCRVCNKFYDINK